MRRLMCHICCGICAIYPVKCLTGMGWDIGGFWYNPNIHPYQEYQARKMTAGFVCRKLGIPFEDGASYDPRRWLLTVSRDKAFPEEKSARCFSCCYDRLNETAQFARNKGFDAFTTTLIFSRYQQHEAIRRMGTEIAAREGISFLYEDFRKGWEEAMRHARQWGLYRQKYCGCVLSEQERIQESAGKKSKDTHIYGVMT